ncbi:hypothetical protein EXE59_16630 [Nocardioides eburneiflavus]|uniref:Uncharacterized protein n=1 Tax=Nocardioides eburneiflavus TaxID=2518372 RepID=A0A4Z1CMP6_9ACTN|nr:hypothetical protein [Nocardioides eburneiflavus]TGN65399.1 hypothetical protein EXE59_16630 [Nocardioides eburneiflavus]
MLNIETITCYVVTEDERDELLSLRAEVADLREKNARMERIGGVDDHTIGSLNADVSLLRAKVHYEDCIVACCICSVGDDCRGSPRAASSRERPPAHPPRLTTRRSNPPTRAHSLH